MIHAISLIKHSIEALRSLTLAMSFRKEVSSTMPDSAII
nr:unnamed protein product [Callosobruchus chinensis]